MTEFTESQQKALEEMRENAKSLPPLLANDNLLIEDRLLLRFLRARNYDVPVAFKMMKDCFEWRRTFQGVGPAGVTEESIKNELLTEKGFFYKLDKQSRPVFYIRVRLHDSNSRDMEECQRYCVWNMEKGRQMCVPPVETVCMVFDLGGFSLKNMVEVIHFVYRIWIIVNNRKKCT